MRKVLFVSAHDSGGSQLSAAFFNNFSAPALVKAVSAVPRPADRVPPEVAEAMREIGFDLNAARPQLLTPELARSANLLVCVGSPELCPSVPSQRRLDWAVDEPRSWSLEHVRSLRDELRGRVWRLVAKEGWYKLQPASAIHSLVLQPGV